MQVKIMAKNVKIKSGQLPQEIEVWYVLPALRREFAKALIKEHSLTQKKVAALLQITEAAVSQYISGKRACAVEFSKDILNEIKKSAKKVVEEDATLFIELERISKLLTVKKVVCDMCRESNDWIKRCGVCFND